MIRSIASNFSFKIICQTQIIIFRSQHSAHRSFHKGSKHEKNSLLHSPSKTTHHSPHHSKHHIPKNKFYFPKIRFHSPFTKKLFLKCQKDSLKDGEDPAAHGFLDRAAYLKLSKSERRGIDEAPIMLDQYIFFFSSFFCNIF